VYSSGVQTAIAWVVNPGDVREEVVGFHFPGPVSAADVRLLYRGEDHTGGADVPPLMLDLP
jgi:hypothetical protein